MANGLFAGGDGSENNPYLIEDAFDLDAVRNNLSGHYKLINDIDLDVAPFNEGEGWIPIDSTDNPGFRGVFNGSGFTIKNLYIKRDSIRQSLFGNINSAIIKDLLIKNAYVEGSLSTSGLYGSSSNTSILVSTADRGVSSNFSKIHRIGILDSYLKGGSFSGGLIGHINGTIEVRNCYVEIKCSFTSNSNSGGFCGYNQGDMGIGDYYNCYASIINLGSLEISSLCRSGNFYNSFFNKDKNENSERGIGLTTQEMLLNKTFIDSDWDKEELEDGTKIWKLIDDDGDYPRLWFEYNPLSKILIKDSTGKIISRNTENTAWIDTLKTTITGNTFETYGMKSYIVSSLTSANWNSLYSDVNFTAPFEFQVFKEDDVAPVLTETTTENEFGVIARSFEVEIDETELEKVRNLVVQ